MAIALVSAGAVATNTATAASRTVAPAYGATPTSGNLLIARLSATTQGTSGSGWSCPGWAVIQAASGPECAIAYKTAGAGETSPTFTFTNLGTLSITVWASLIEVSGAGSLDKRATGAPFGSSPFALAASAADASAGSLAVAAVTLRGTKSGTATISDTWTPSGGTKVAATNTGTTKGLAWYHASAYITTSNASADTDTVTVTLSTGSADYTSYAIATFGPAGVGPPAATSLIYDDRRIRRNSLLRR